MSLSRKTAAKIVDAVAADATCKRAIQTNPAFDLFFAGRMLALEFTGTAGSARNALMLLEGKDFSDDDVAEKICLGIALATANAIRKAEITEIASLATSHRRHLGIEHEATYLGTYERSSQYIFDWHATLRIRDPIISHYDDWQAARGGTHYFWFLGFD